MAYLETAAAIDPDDTGVRSILAEVHMIAGRLEEALALCSDPRLDVLVRGSTAFADIPARIGAILDDPETLCHLIRYPE